MSFGWPAKHPCDATSHRRMGFFWTVQLSLGPIELRTIRHTDSPSPPSMDHQHVNYGGLIDVLPSDKEIGENHIAGCCRPAPADLPHYNSSRQGQAQRRSHHLSVCTTKPT